MGAFLVLEAIRDASVKSRRVKKTVKKNEAGEPARESSMEDYL